MDLSATDNKSQGDDQGGGNCSDSRKTPKQGDKTHFWEQSRRTQGWFREYSRRMRMSIWMVARSSNMTARFSFLTCIFLMRGKSASRAFLTMAVYKYHGRVWQGRLVHTGPGSADRRGSCALLTGSRSPVKKLTRCHHFLRLTDWSDSRCVWERGREDAVLPKR